MASTEALKRHETDRESKYLTKPYDHFGNAVILLLLLAGAACLAVTWVIDASRATRDILVGIFRPRSSDDERDKHHGDDSDVARERAVEQLRKQEEVATARYNVAAGPLEDVLRAKAIRLQAEIELIRDMAARRQSKILGDR